MEALIFGSFVVFSLVALAFHFMAKQTDLQKKSVSNANFVSFQRSFFLVYFMALLGDWLQGPYVYKLYSYYGYPESQVGNKLLLLVYMCTGGRGDDAALMVIVAKSITIYFFLRFRNILFRSPYCMWPDSHPVCSLEQ